MSLEKTPLEAWHARKITGSSLSVLTSQQIKDYQLNKLRKVLDCVRQKSPFYKRHFAKADYFLSNLGDLANIPFTTGEDLRHFGQDMICVKAGDIARIVTLQTTGTTGQPKRVFFTEEDQELTVDFFHHGMLTLVKPGDRVLILLPGKVSGSVGDLLQRGLARAGVEGIIHGPVSNPLETLKQMNQDKINVLVGIPTQVLTLARIQRSMHLSIPPLRSVLLTTDHVPHSIIRELVRVWECEVFNHYGMTEMGLGGGVDCQGFKGYHLREADLYFEIVDPLTNQPVQEGQLGEIVFSTLTRTGMPLIRYRTGDYSRFITEDCPCGTVLGNMERVRSRDRIELGDGKILSMADLDEVIFPWEGVLDFTAQVAEKYGKRVLTIEVYLDSASSEEGKQHILGSVQGHSVLQAILTKGEHQLIMNFKPEASFSPGNGTRKRMIIDQRK